MLGRATGNTNTQDSPRPQLRGSHHLPPYSILFDWPWSLHPNGFSLSGLPSWSPEIPKSCQLGLLQLWSPITLQADLQLRCNLKQNCTSRQELSNGMLHVICKQINRVNSRLFLVRSQIDSLTPGLSFGHNLSSRCLNEQCEPILNICVSRFPMI